MMIWKLYRSHCVMFLSEFMLICTRSQWLSSLYFRIMKQPSSGNSWQLHCFQLRTTSNGKDFKGFFVMGYAQRSRASSFNTCMKSNSLTNECGNKLTRGSRFVFALMLFSIFIDQNPKFFLCMCWRRMFCFSVHSPWEKSLKSFPF